MDELGRPVVGQILKRERLPIAIEAIGESNDTGLYPVKLADGFFRLVWGNYFTIDSEDVIRESIEMPRVSHGLGSDVFHVSGRDKIGPFFLNVF